MSQLYDDLDDSLEIYSSSPALPSQPSASYPATSQPSSVGHLSNRKRKQSDLREAFIAKRLKFSAMPGEEKFMKWVHYENQQLAAIYCEVCDKFISKYRGGGFYDHVKICKASISLDAIPPAPLTRQQKIGFRDTMLSSMAKNLLPFSHFSTEGFKECIQAAIKIGYETKVAGCGPPDAKELICSRNTLCNDLMVHVESHIPELYEFIKKNVKNNGGSMAVDMTSSKKHFVGTVVHFIDDYWKLRTLPIDLHEFKESATASNIIDDSEKMLEDLDLCLNDFSIVTDEGANVVSAFSTLYDHYRCACHILHTVCKRSLTPYKRNNDIYLSEAVKESIDDMSKTISNLKSTINTIRARLSLHNSLNSKLSNDCETRWLSKLKMVESFLNLTEEDLEKIEETLRDDKNKDLRKKFVQAKNDRLTLKTFVEVFKPFEKALRTLEAEHIPTFNMVLPVLNELEEHLKEACNSPDILKSNLANSAYEVLKYKKNFLVTDKHSFAVILDPLMKNQLVKILGKEEFERVKLLFEDEFGTLADQNGPEEDENPFITGATISELNIYYTIKVDKNKENEYDVLQWWKENATSFPTLSKMARKILSTPASSASIERLFSSLKLMTPSERSSLTTDKLKNLVLYRSIDCFKKFVNLP